MVFSSCTFLFIFLPIIFILYGICPTLKYKNALLILASLFFYAFGEPVYIILMLISIVANYFFARAIAWKTPKVFLTIAVIFNIGLLVVFKYSALLVGTCNAVFHTTLPVPQIALPIGISFYTFQALSYVVDVYRNPKEVQKKFGRVMLYISFFPQLIAGPIVKYHDIAKQLENRKQTLDLTITGIERFIYGLAKKVIIANTMALIVDTLYKTSMQMALTAWLVAICYCLQIYFDFSGYSDMAIGLGRMFGFTFLENFNYPYTASSIQEFWRRWHISLSTWFKEYLYIPLGGNRKGRGRTMLNKSIVFLCTGIWHGANWTFLCWGVWHGIFILLEYQNWIPLAKKKIIGRIYTMLVVIGGFVIFRAETMGQAFGIFKAMFTGFEVNMTEYVTILNICNPYRIMILGIAILLCAPIAKMVRRPVVMRIAVTTCLLFCCMMSLATNSYNPFIYFRF